MSRLMTDMICPTYCWRAYIIARNLAYKSTVVAIAVLIRFFHEMLSLMIRGYTNFTFVAS